MNEGFLCEAEGQERVTFALLSFPDPSSPDWKGNPQVRSDEGAW